MAELALQLMAVDVLQYNFKTKTDNTYFCGNVIFAEGQSREARFFKSDGYTAKRIWEETSNLQHEAILKLWFVSYCGPLQCWIICYDRFEHLLDSWLNMPNINTPVRKYDDLLHPDFCPTISYGSIFTIFFSCLFLIIKFTNCFSINL